MLETLGDPALDLARVRQVLTRELETISTYEQLAREATSEEVRAFLLHLAQEEKEHVAEATYLLRKLDTGQDAQFQKGFSTEHFTDGKPAPNVQMADLRVPPHPGKVVYALPFPATSHAGQLTVGSLRRREPTGT